MLEPGGKAELEPPRLGRRDSEWSQLYETHLELCLGPEKPLLRLQLAQDVVPRRIWKGEEKPATFEQM